MQGGMNVTCQEHKITEHYEQCIQGSISVKRMPVSRWPRAALAVSGHWLIGFVRRISNPVCIASGVLILLSHSISIRQAPILLEKAMNSMWTWRSDDDNAARGHRLMATQAHSWRRVRSCVCTSNFGGLIRANHGELLTRSSFQVLSVPISVYPWFRPTISSS